VIAEAQRFFQPRQPTPWRARTAFGVAIATDILQVALGPFGWAFADEILDVIAAVILTSVLGFHPLLLPTFVVEFLPITDLLPTWTGCVALVLTLRRRERATQPPPAPTDVIDV
jgi:hypothetical protein